MTEMKHQSLCPYPDHPLSHDCTYCLLILAAKKQQAMFTANIIEKECARSGHSMGGVCREHRELISIILWPHKEPHSSH